MLTHSLSIYIQTYQPSKDPWIPRDLTYDAGIQGFAEVCFGWATL